MVKPPGWKGSVINMSLHMGNAPSLARAIKMAYYHGIPIAAAAGNNNTDASRQYPCVYVHLPTSVNMQRLKSTFLYNSGMKR